MVVVVAVALVIVKVTSGGSTPPSGSSNFQAASPTTVQQITHVPASVFNAVGVTSPSVAPPSPSPGRENLPVLDATNASGQKVPVILYEGGEFCPYCAAQRWSIIVALSRFGTFSDLGNMSSYCQRRLPQHADLHVRQDQIHVEVPGL